MPLDGMTLTLSEVSFPKPVSMGVGYPTSTARNEHYGIYCVQGLHCQGVPSQLE